MKFIIDRQRWICGIPAIFSNAGCFHGDGDTLLLNEKGYMCCLGQISEQLGVNRDYLKYITRPNFLGNEYRTEMFTEILIDDKNAGNSDLAQEAMNINDDASTTLEEKEVLLTKLFGEDGHELEFINEY